MSIPKFESGFDLADYVTSHGPKVDEAFLKFIYGSEAADEIYDYLVEAIRVAPNEPLDELFAVVRENIRLVDGDESCLELADFVGAPEDCFA